MVGKWENIMAKRSNLVLRRKAQNKFPGAPLVIAYHPLFKTFDKIIKKDLHLLYMIEEVKKSFTLGPMISFSCTRRLTSYLIRAKSYPLERSDGCFKCKSSVVTYVLIS